MRLHVSASGDTSSSRLFSLRIQKIDSTRFESYRILRIEPMAANSFLYVANYEITSVRWDSTGENVHRNRYYFERSLWSYNETTGEHTKLLKLPKPEREQELVEWDVTPDGRFVAYRDGRNVYLVDLGRKTVKKIDGDEDENLENPIISNDGDYVLTSNGYGKFKIYERSGGDSWLAISRRGHDIEGFPAFSPDNQYIHYANNSADTTGIKRVRTLHHYYNGSENREGSRWITRVDTLFNIPKDKRNEIDMGQPYFINPNRFMIIANFKNIFDFNDECI